MFVLATDFGNDGPYVAQMRAVLAAHCPAVACVALFSDLPAFDIQAAAYLLPAYIEYFPQDSVFIGVVDPGVGGARDALVVRAFDRYFVGPDNGLFELICRRDPHSQVSRIMGEKGSVSRTFHGRDVFSPMAVQLMCGGQIQDLQAHSRLQGPEQWPDDLWKVVYIDHFGNAITGLRGATLDLGLSFTVAGRVIHSAETFSSVSNGELFWYVNSNGLVEFAVNKGRADQLPGLGLGVAFNIA